MRSSLIALCVLFGALSLEGSAFPQSVRRVAADGSAAFLDIQSAVDAAAPDDTILVAPGTYATPVIDKPLRIVGDGDGVLMEISEDPIEIRNIAAGETVYLGRIATAVAPATPFVDLEGRIRIQDCAGIVWLEDLTAADFWWLNSSIEVDDSAHVVLQRCDLGVGTLRAERSGLHVFDSSFEGLFYAHWIIPGRGDPGIALVDTFCSLQNSTVQGGRGLAYNPSSINRDGGPGVLSEGASTIVYRACSIEGGPGGTNGTDYPPGADGLPIEVVDGLSVVTPLSGPAHQLTVEPVVRVGIPFMHRVDGPPGHRIVLLYAFEPVAVPFPAFAGTLLSAGGYVVLDHGQIPASGSLSIPLTIPALRGDLEVDTLFLQAVALDFIAPAVRLGSGGVLNVLGAGF